MVFEKYKKDRPKRKSQKTQHTFERRGDPGGSFPLPLTSLLEDVRRVDGGHRRHGHGSPHEYGASERGLQAGSLQVCRDQTWERVSDSEGDEVMEFDMSDGDFGNHERIADQMTPVSGMGRHPVTPDSLMGEKTIMTQEARDPEGPANLATLAVRHAEEIAAPPGLDGRSNNRHQEPAAIKFNPIPDVAGFESWRSNVRDTIVAAAGGSMEAYLWILEVEDPSLDFEHLSDVGIFQSIDAKIADAVSKIQRGVIAKQLTMMKTQAARNKTLVSGRQQLRFIYDE